MSLLGKTVKDKSIGMIGRATLYTKSEYGLEQYLVEPEWTLELGSEGRLLEADRLEEIGFVEKESINELLEENRGQVFRK